MHWPRAGGWAIITVMPWLLYRSLLAELLKNICFTTGVLVTVIAFGAAIKPLAGGLLAPTDVGRYVALAIVPMLQFALPFSAGFGATMVLHRMTTDNEIHAAAVSGISYPRLLLPVVILGLVLSCLMLGLVHYVIPHFWVRMEHVATKDATRILQASVERGEAFAFGDFQVFAEAMTILEPPAGTRVKSRLRLESVAAARLDRNGRIITDVTAERAIADIYERNGSDHLHLAMTDAVVFDGEENRLFFASRAETQNPIPLPTSFSAKPKFMSLPRLRQIAANPDLFDEIASGRIALANEVEQYETWRSLEARMAADDSLELTGPDRGWRYVIHAQRLRRGEFSARPGQTIRVEEFAESGQRRSIECASAGLSILTSRDFGLLFNLVLRDCTITYANENAARGRSFQQGELTLFDLMPTGMEASRPFHALSSADLLERAGEITDEPRVSRAAAALREDLAELRLEVRARIAQRNALSATGLLLLLVGALLAIVMKNALPLSVSLVAFFPSIADTLLISGGEQMMREGDLTRGLLLMWSGNALLAGIALTAFWRLSRN